MIWIHFIISAVIIIWSGSRLTSYADILSDRFNIHKAWLGVAFLGLVTSLPEAITSITAVVSLDAVDLAVGNLLGSNNINPMIIVVMDFFYRKDSITNKIAEHNVHVAPAMFAILLPAVVLGEITLTHRLTMFNLGYLSLGNVLIAGIYLLGIRVLARIEESPVTMVLDQKIRDSAAMPLPKIFFNLLISTVLVVVGAIWLANAGATLAHTTGLGETFVGSLFLALVTSLPEIVVSLSALKIGSLNLAVGNIFGSNMVNIFIVFLCGLFHTKGPILSFVSPAHVVTIILSIIIVSLAMIGMSFKNKRKIWGLGLDSIAMLICFLIGTGIIYRLR